jgi:superfamily II DNA or RNA helicase/HKD family nuclease
MKPTEARSLLSAGLRTGFIDRANRSEGDFRPHLVLNDPPNGNVLSTIVKELDRCSSFEFSVAFMTTGGVAMLFQALCDAQARGVQGKILTTDYLVFTDPQAIKEIYEKFPNIEIRVYTGKPFHAKGYLFTHENGSYTTMIIGSSNLTPPALATSREWNVRLVSLEEGELLEKARTEFLEAWDSAVRVSDAWLMHYGRLYRKHHERPLMVSASGEESYSYRDDDSGVLQPNSMQSDALESLSELRLQGKRRALVVSATGTGKTFLCAFDVKAFRPKRFLYIVHREQIARNAMESFKTVFGKELSCGLLGNGRKYAEVPFVFSMVQTLSKDDVLHSFDPSWFDYIVVDEVHRSGADSYRKVIDYFKPKFLLGMTATPERTDGFDIYGLFDNTIAYEIRLNDALEADLLCPFHYFGISDLTVDGTSLEKLSDFSRLEQEQWVRKIYQTINRYSIGLVRRRGLIFCSRNKEARLLSAWLNELGMRTLAVSGMDDPLARDEAFRRLELEDGPDSLEYLVAVDILNEGIDIPSLNQIILLRPTQSPIVFVQQIGRGMRKCLGKQFLTIIDFIGNYTNNYMIPVALYGDTTYKKDRLRNLVSSKARSLNGVSTVSFDRIAKERIYQAINKVSFDSMKFLNEEYFKVRAKLGRVPSLIDFVHLQAVSPLLFLGKYGNYVIFKSKVEKSSGSSMTQTHLQSLSFFSKVIAPGLRPYEQLVISSLLENKKPLDLDALAETTKRKYGFVPDRLHLVSAVSILDNGFFKESDRKKFGNISYCSLHGGTIVPSEQFLRLAEHREYRRELEDILLLGAYEYLHGNWKDRDENDLVLYNKYTRQDVCRLLGWEKDLTATLYGYRLHYPTMTCPIFVTYHKDTEHIDPSINYIEGFESPGVFDWETRTRVNLQSKEPKALRGEDSAGRFKTLLFVKKSDDEGCSFYYMGKLSFVSNCQAEKKDKNGKSLPIVQMKFLLENRVPDYLYDYLCELVSEDSAKCS